MHRELAAEGTELLAVSGRLQGHENADFPEPLRDLVVDVSGNHALLDSEGLATTQRHILADRGNQLRQFLTDRAPRFRIGCRGKLLQAAALLQREAGSLRNELLKLLVTSNEVRLRIDFDDGAPGPLGHHSNQALGSRATCLLGCSGQALLAQPVNGGLYIAVVFRDRK